jgi:hypothetical protein
MTTYYEVVMFGVKKDILKEFFGCYPELSKVSLLSSYPGDAP